MAARKNASLDVLHECLRSHLNLDHNRTEERIEERLLEHRVARETFEGQRIVKEYTQMAVDMRVTDDLKSKANLAIAGSMTEKVLPLLTAAYIPLVHQEETLKLENRSTVEAEALVAQRLTSMQSGRDAAAAMQTSAQNVLNAATQQSVNAERLKQAMINTKVNQIYELVKAHGSAALQTQMKTAMDDLATATTNVESGSGNVMARSIAATARGELDDAIAMASASISGTPGSTLSQLKIEISELRKPPSLLETVTQLANNSTANTTSTPASSVRLLDVSAAALESL